MLTGHPALQLSPDPTGYSVLKGLGCKHDWPLITGCSREDDSAAPPAAQHQPEDRLHR